MMNINLNDTLGVIVVCGMDSATFLQGQLSNDINLLEDGQYQYSANLNTKGRILASFWVYKHHDEYYLITTKNTLEKTIARLKMYILRSKVEISKLEINISFSSNIHDLTVKYKLELLKDHYLCLTHDENGSANLDAWKLFLINHGIPQIYQETQELVIPQHINFDAIGGLNFKKGCYIGQEIVARMHYLGKSKRKMYRFICDFEPQIGSAVVSPKLKNQEVGNIIEVCKREVDYIGLVTLQPDCMDECYLDSANTKLLLIQEILYIKN